MHACSFFRKCRNFLRRINKHIGTIHKCIYMHDKKIGLTWKSIYMTINLFAYFFVSHDFHCNISECHNRMFINIIYTINGTDSCLRIVISYTAASELCAKHNSHDYAIIQRLFDISSFIRIIKHNYAPSKYRAQCFQY